MNEMAEILAQVMDGMAPIFETAAGIRQRLEAEGWSPTAAEKVALEWLLGMIRKCMAA